MLETIRELLDQHPFHAFRIVLTSGDRYEVSHPHLLAIGETMIFYCYPRSDKFAYLRLNQIAAIDTFQSAA
jgi:hypothetical protein